MRTNCLLSDFSFYECSTLSHLFNTYCMNIYGSPLWKYYDKKLLLVLELFYVAWRKSLRRVWNISDVQARVQGEWPGPPLPLEIEKQKKKSSEQILSYFTYVLLLF